MKKINKIVSTFLYIVKITSFVSLYSCGNSVKQPVDLANSFNKNVQKKEPQKSIAAPKQNENTGINSEKLLTLMSCSRSTKDDKTTTTNKKAKNNKKKNNTKNKKESTKEKSPKEKSHGKKSPKEKSHGKKSPKEKSHSEKPHSEESYKKKSHSEESHGKKSPEEKSPKNQDEKKETIKSGIDSLDALQDLIKVVKEEKNSKYEINVVWFASGNIKLNGGKIFSVANEEDFSTLLKSFEKLKKYKVQINGLDAILSSGETNKINEGVFIWKNAYFWKNINKFVKLFNIKKKFSIKICTDSQLVTENKVLIKDFGVCDFISDDVVDNIVQPQIKPLVRQNSFAKIAGAVKNKISSPRKSPNKKIKSDFDKIFTLEENI